MTEEQCQPGAPDAGLHAPLYLLINHSQSYGLAPILHVGLQNGPSMAMTSTPGPQPPPRSLDYQLIPTGSTADSTVNQLCKPIFILPKGVAVTSAHSSKPLTEDASQKMELRLMRKREAGWEYRRRKKEKFRCLENRVAMLENQNKALIEEIKALKDIHQHKV